MRISVRHLALGALLAISPAVASAVTVSPNALFIDSRTRSGVLTLYNPGTTAEEIEITFAFGYPRSDLAGAISVALADSAPAGEPSVLGFVRAFPRRLRLEPGQRQTVRILMQPPAGLPEGEYWGRVLIRSRGGRPPVEQQQGGIHMQIDNQLRLIHMNAQHPADLKPSMHGHSVGHWEGDTLVIDTIGFDPRSQFNDGFIHGPNLHAVERYRVIEGGKILEKTFTYTDPDALTEPYTFTRRQQRTDKLFQEYVNAQNNTLYECPTNVAGSKYRPVE